MNSDIKLIIGLGNPGRKYENTYHNAGFLFIDYLEKNPGENSKLKIIKSDEYMNKSGKFVAEAVKKEGIESEELLVAHDDSDLELGTYKLQIGRGAGGHHGVESIQQHLKTNEFWRLRIGIRPSPSDLSAKGLPTAGASAKDGHHLKAGEFVLKKISPSDKKILESVFEEIAEELK